MTAQEDSTTDADTPERLVHAAFETFVEHGYEAARVQDIAGRAGLTTGAIYGRFENKADLLAATIGHHGSSFLELALSDLVSTPDGSVIEALAIECQVGPIRPIHTVLSDVVAIAARDQEVHAALMPLLDQVKEAFRMAVTDGQRAGAIDPEVSVDSMVHLAVTLLLGSFMMKGLRLEQPSVPDARRTMQRLVSCFGPP